MCTKMLSYLRSDDDKDGINNLYKIRDELASNKMESFLCVYCALPEGFLSGRSTVPAPLACGVN